MTRQSKADVFISVLAQMLEDDREHRAMRRRVQSKARAERFDLAFRTKPKAESRLGDRAKNLELTA